MTIIMMCLVGWWEKDGVRGPLGPEELLQAGVHIEGSLQHLRRQSLPHRSPSGQMGEYWAAKTNKYT